MDFTLENFKKELMQIVQKFKNQKFASVKTADGKELFYDGDTPKVGASVQIEGATAPDGDYKLEDGTMVVVKEGKIIDLKPAEPKEEDMAKVTELITKIVDEKMSALTDNFTKQFNELKSSFETKSAEATQSHSAEVQTLSEKFEKEMAFSKEVMLFLEKIPDGKTQKPKTKTHKIETDFEAELKEWKKKHNL